MQASLGRQRAATAGAEASSSTTRRPPRGGEVGAGTRAMAPVLFAPARALLFAHHRSALVAAARLALSAAASSSTTAASNHRRASASAASSASSSLSPPTAPASAPPQQPPSATLVDASQRERLAAFLDHLLLTNESMNLTAVRDPQEAWTRHVEDSLALVPVIERWVAATAGVAGGAAGAAASVSAPAAALDKKKGKDRRKKQPQPQQAWFEEEEEEAVEAAASTPDEQAPPPRPPAPEATTATTTTPSSALRLIDVGTGPGLPGMILAIARPNWRVTLLDSLRKRCDFLRAAATRLGLTNVDVVWSRAEDAGRQPALRDVHDVAVARAVAESRVLAELCLPFVKPGGVWVAAKGAAIEGEVEAAAKAIAALKGRVLAVEPVDSFYASGAAVPGVEVKGEEEDAAADAVRRTAIVVAKLAPTPAAYPRPPGTPNKKPL